MRIYLSIAITVFLGIFVSGITDKSSFLDFIQKKILATDNFNENRPILPEYDFIVIGAGTAGSVIANRLTENPKWNVLVLEYGEEETVITDIPLLAPISPISDYVYKYKSEPAKTNKSGGFCLSYKNKRCPLCAGKVIGGSSVANFMVYARGSPDVFDEWGALGNPGWTYEEVLPYFKKSEKCVIPNLDHRYRGYEGKVYTSVVNYNSSIKESFLKAGEELGYKYIDYNSNETIGFSVMQSTLKNGRRISASKAYLRPIKKRQNFYLYKSSLVTRIVIDENTKQAIGVEFTRYGKKYFVKANKEVILSAGALNSPRLLMLSGVGPKDHLKSFNINVIEDLPVGYDLQDHVVVPVLTFLINKPSAGSPFEISSIFNYIFKGTGLLSVPGGTETIAFLSTKDENAKKDSNIPKRPDIEIVPLLGSFVENTTADQFKEVFGLSDEFWESVFAKYQNSNSFSLFLILSAPKSRGRVSLKSADPLDDPIIDMNYLDHEDDVKILVNGIKKVIEISSTKAFQRLNATMVPLEFPGCNHEEYLTDAFWSCLVRHTSGTVWHYSGTCRMSPRENSGVVDHRLKVYNIKSLRVIDNSIIPILPTGHAAATAYMLAEKASDMIKEDWKFKTT